MNNLTKKDLDYLKEELANFEEIANYLKPTRGEIPKLKGIDIYGESMALNGIIGGDHITYLDFKQRYDLDRRIQEATNETIKKHLEMSKQKAGILLADVSGHNITDAMMVSQLHQAFLTGARYELDIYGEITTNLFENLNTRFYKSSSFSKFITMIYGEIIENGAFRFISAGHEPPVLFSGKYDKIIETNEYNFKNSQVIGFMPSKEDIDSELNKNSVGFKDKYHVNEWHLMNQNDLLILHTDGLSEHDETYFAKGLEKKLKEIKYLSSEEIFNEIKKDLFAIKKPEDDITYVVIKKE